MNSDEFDNLATYFWLGKKLFAQVPRFDTVALLYYQFKIRQTELSAHDVDTQLAEQRQLAERKKFVDVKERRKERKKKSKKKELIEY